MSMTPMGGKSKGPSGYKTGQFQNFTPEMMDMLKQLIGQLGPDSYLAKIAGGDEEAFEQSEAGAKRDFTGVQGNIASRFSGMGMGGRKSSGFTNTMNKASSDFAQDLQGKRTDMRMKAINDMINMSNQVLQQRPYENYVQEKSEKSNWIPYLTAAAGGVAGYYTNGWGGAVQGAGMGYKAGGG